MLCLTQTSTGFTNSSLQASPLEALQHSKNCSKESSKPAQAQVPMADAQLGCQKCTQFGEVGGFNPPVAYDSNWEHSYTIDYRHTNM